MLHLNPAELEEKNFVVATDGDWDRAEASELGQLHPERCWILTDRDVWHRNPNFVGPTEPHPEDDDREDLCTCPESPANHQELCSECRLAFERDQEVEQRRLELEERAKTPDLDPPF